MISCQILWTGTFTASFQSFRPKGMLQQKTCLIKQNAERLVSFLFLWLPIFEVLILFWLFIVFTGSKALSMSARSDYIYLPPATKLGQGYVFTRVCDSVHRGVVSQHALQVVSQHALQQVSGVGGIPACFADFQAHTQGGSWGEGSGQGGGLQAHTQGGSWGVWPGGLSRLTQVGVSRPTPGGSPGPHPGGGGSPGPHLGGLQVHTKGGIPACTEADPLKATAAGGTHPTGMHSGLNLLN